MSLLSIILIIFYMVVGAFLWYMANIALIVFALKFYFKLREEHCDKLVRKSDEFAEQSRFN